MLHNRALGGFHAPMFPRAAQDKPSSGAGTPLQSKRAGRRSHRHGDDDDDDDDDDDGAGLEGEEGVDAGTGMPFKKRGLGDSSSVNSPVRTTLCLLVCCRSTRRCSEASCAAQTQRLKVAQEAEQVAQTQQGR